MSNFFTMALNGLWVVDVHFILKTKTEEEVKSHDLAANSHHLALDNTTIKFCLQRLLGFLVSQVAPSFMNQMFSTFMSYITSCHLNRQIQQFCLSTNR